MLFSSLFALHQCIHIISFVISFFSAAVEAAANGSIVNRAMEFDDEGTHSSKFPSASKRVSGQVDMLSLLRGFAQGVGVAGSSRFQGPESAHFFKNPHALVSSERQVRAQQTIASSATDLMSNLLELTVKYGFQPQYKKGPLASMDLYKLYWVLCHKVSLWTYKPTLSEPACRFAYKKLAKFVQDDSLPGTTVDFRYVTSS